MPMTALRLRTFSTTCSAEITLRGYHSRVDRSTWQFSTGIDRARSATVPMLGVLRFKSRRRLVLRLFFRRFEGLFLRLFLLVVRDHLSNGDGVGRLACEL